MQEIELSPKKKFNLKYGGAVYEIRKPSLGESRQFQAMVGSTDGDQEKKFDAVLSYLSSLGLPREIAEQFDGDELEELITKLSAKKNLAT